MSSIAVNSLNNGGGGGGMLNTLTGNSGGAVSPDAFHNIDVVGDGTTIDVVGNPGLNTLTISFIGSVTESFMTDDGNSAVPAANVINMVGGTNMNTTAVPNLGPNVIINLNPSILLPHTTAAINGVIAFGATLAGDYFIHNFGTDNAFFGRQSGNFTLSGANNTAVGLGTLNALTTGNTNLALGALAGAFLTTGTANVLVGPASGGAYTTESSNVLINNPGIAADAHVIRIGNQGIGVGEQAATWIAGIYNVGIVSVPVAASVVNIGSDGQLGNVQFTSLDGSVTITQTDNSHLDFAAVGGGGGAGIVTLIPNSGATATATNTHLVGGTNITTVGTAGNTITINQVNTSVTLNSGNNITVTGGTPLTLGGVASIAVTGTVNDAVLLGNGTGSITSLTPIGLASQVLTSNGPGLAPSWQNATGGSSFSQPFSYVQVGDTGARASGTNYSLGATVVLTQLFDIGGNVFPGNGIGGAATFTAPATGYYYFEMLISAKGSAVPTLVNALTIQILTTSLTYQSKIFQGNGVFQYFYTTLAQMTIGDTATFSGLNIATPDSSTYYVSGNGGALGTNINSTRISGYRVA